MKESTKKKLSNLNQASGKAYMAAAYGRDKEGAKMIRDALAGGGKSMGKAMYKAASANPVGKAGKAVGKKLASMVKKKKK